jgi:DNA-binding GntR family transcriptional regulator
MPLTKSTAALQRTLARDDVYRTIKNSIILLELAPDEVLRDQDIAEHLGVSRTPVREALRRLEDEGLVVTSFHKWTKVAPTDLQEMTSLYPVVAALEATAVELAQPQLSTSDLDRLRELNLDLAQAIAQADVDRSLQLDADFHALLIERSGNAVIGNLLATLRPRIERIERAHFGNQLVAQESVQEHALMIQALERGDGQQAAVIMKKNWLL